MGLLDLVLPERCAVCGRVDAPVCAACSARFLPIRPPLCARCGAPVAWPVARCLECAGRRLAFASARAAVSYEGPSVRLVGVWKEGGQRALAREVAEVVVTALARPAADAITFVPAVADRALWRGHNPAESLARALAGRWRLPLVGVLDRAPSPRRQRGLALAERRRNVAGAFTVRGRAPPVVLLVDDVYTTGSTVSAAASALRRAGARRVDVITFARALRGRRAS